MCVHNEGVCLRVKAACGERGAGGKENHSTSDITCFPENIHLLFLFFQAELTSLIAKILPKPPWKINSRVFGIP